MFFNIDDLVIKRKIAEYNEGNERYFSSIVEEISTFIYNFPGVIYHVSEDNCSGFYEYILTRLKVILKSYSVSKAKFTTWFTVVLRNRYLNFIREKATNKYNSNTDISFDQDIEEKGINLHMFIADKREYNFKINELKLNNLNDKITNILNERYRVLFHLYYIDLLRTEDVRFLSIYLKRSINEILLGIDNIKNSIVDRYEKREAILFKLANNYRSIVKFQVLKDTKLEEIAKERQEILLNDYRAAKCYPTYESIASFCGFPIGTVATGISRMKTKIMSIKQELQEIIEK